MSRHFHSGWEAWHCGFEFSLDDAIMPRSIILAIAHWISPASNRSKWPTSTWENSAKLKPRLAAASAFSTSSNVVGGIVGSEMALATHLSNCYSSGKRLNKSPRPLAGLFTIT